VIVSSLGMRPGPDGQMKSEANGGGSLYLSVAKVEPDVVDFGLGFGSGVALSEGRGPPFDSLFFSDSFFDLAALSRTNVWVKSGLRGDDTAG